MADAPDSDVAVVGAGLSGLVAALWRLPTSLRRRGGWSGWCAAGPTASHGARGGPSSGTVDRWGSGSDALARRAASDEVPLRIRIGIHTGDANRQHGDFHGRSVISAARIADQAEGGDILVSALVKELVEGRGDITLRDAGEFELKGLVGRQRLHRVVWSPPEQGLLAGAEPAAIPERS